jgi:hypothetical protein
VKLTPGYSDRFDLDMNIPSHLVRLEACTRNRTLSSPRHARPLTEQEARLTRRTDAHRLRIRNADRARERESSELSFRVLGLTRPATVSDGRKR